MTRDEMDPDPLVCDDVSRRRSEKARVLIEKGKPDDQEKDLPKVQSKLTVQQPGQQPGADQQDHDFSRRVHPWNIRLVNVEPTVLEGMLAAQVRYPCPGLPSHQEQSNHND